MRTLLLVRNGVSHDARVLRAARVAEQTVGGGALVVGVATASAPAGETTVEGVRVLRLSVGRQLAQVPADAGTQTGTDVSTYTSTPTDPSPIRDPHRRSHPHGPSDPQELSGPQEQSDPGRRSHTSGQRGPSGRLTWST